MDWKQRKAAYFEKLKDPRWQKKRLEVFERDEWTCQLCGRKDITLHVHHARYEDGDPWDTSVWLLFTACAECHEEEHENHRYAITYLLDVLGQMGIRTSMDLFHLSDAAQNEAVELSDYAPRHEFTFEQLTKGFGIALQQFADTKNERIAENHWFRDPQT